MEGFATTAHVAQLVERVLGKDEVTSSILVVGSRMFLARGPNAFLWVPRMVLCDATGSRCPAGVTQWLESRPSKPLVAGSNPVSRSDTEEDRRGIVRSGFRAWKVSRMCGGPAKAGRRRLCTNYGWPGARHKELEKLSWRKRNTRE